MAEDLLDTVDRQVVTSETPRTQLTSEDIAQPKRMMAGALEKLSAATMDMAKPLAERLAADQLANQKVTIGPDGKMQVINPAQSIIFGEAGQDYSRAVRAGTILQAEPLVNQQLTEIHMKNLGNPEKQKTANDAFVSSIQGATGNPVLDQAIRGRAAETAGRHYDSNVEFTSRLQLQNSERTLNASIESTQEDLAVMARGGAGPGNDKYDQKKAALDGLMAEKQANPLFKDPPAMAALQQKQFDMRLKGETLIGQIPKLIDDQGMIAARGQLKDYLSRPDLEPKTRAYLRVEANNALAEATPKWNAETRAFDLTLENDLKHLAQNPGDYNNPDIQQHLRFGLARGYDRAPELQAIIANAPMAKALQRATPAERDRELGITPPASALPAPEPPTGPSPAGGPWARTSTGEYVATDKAGNAVPDVKPPITQAAFTPTPGGRLTSSNPFISRLMNLESVGQNIVSQTDRDSSGRTVAEGGNRNEISQGYFQIQNHPGGTWSKYAKLAGVDTSQYPTPMSAPYDIQWKVASLIPLSQYGPRTVSGLGGLMARGGINTNMTLGEIAARSGGGGFSETAGGGGKPTWTDAQYRANPYLGAFIFHKDNQDPAEKLAWFGAKGRAIETDIKYGGMPSQNEWADMERVHSDHAGDPRYESIYADAKGQFEAALADRGTPDERSKAIFEAAKIAGGTGGDPYQKQQADAFLKWTQAHQEEWNKSPITMGANTGMYPRIPPLDLSDAQKAAQGIAARTAAAAMVGERRGEPVSALEGRDLAQVKQALNFGTMDQKLAIINGMNSMVGHPGVMASTLSKLGKDPQTAPYAVASSLMAENQPQAAQAILQGEELLAKEPRFAPKEDTPDGIAVNVTKNYLPFNDYPNVDSRDAFMRSVRNVYALNAASKGDTSQIYNDEYAKAAVATVTGGIVDYRGHKVIAPVYGGTADDVDRAMRSLTDSDVAGAQSREGPITAAQVNQTMLSPGWTHLTKPVFSLESVPNSRGHYFLFNGDDTNRQYARSPDGRYFILDLTGSHLDVQSTRTELSPAKRDLMMRLEPINLPGASSPSQVGAISAPAGAWNWPTIPDIGEKAGAAALEQAASGVGPGGPP